MMIRRAIVTMVGAAFLLVVVGGCGNEPQPKVTDPNAATKKAMEGDKGSKNVSD